jgi:hypothetical protein
MLEVLFQLLGELLVQVFGEVFLEFGLRSIAEPFRKKPNPWFAALGYAMLGALCGAISLWPFPDHFVPTGMLRYVNLLVTPMLAGACMAALGAWREKNGEVRLRIDQLSYGYLFAFAMAMVRFNFAN